MGDNVFFTDKICSTVLHWYSIDLQCKRSWDQFWWVTMYFSQIKYALLCSIGTALAYNVRGPGVNSDGWQCKMSWDQFWWVTMYFSQIKYALLLQFYYNVELLFFQLKMWYNHKSFELIVTIICSVGLPLSDQGKFRNPYCKLYLLPDRR